MATLTIRPTTTYENVLEPLVTKAVYEQLTTVSPCLIPYIDPGQAIAYALNRLPPLYAASQEGLEYQQRKARDTMTEQINMAARWGINAILQDPLRQATPLLSTSQV